MELVITGRQHLTLALLVGGSQLCLGSNQIAGFFDHPFLWKESINILVFHACCRSLWEGNIRDCHFWLNVTSCASLPI